MSALTAWRAPRILFCTDTYPPQVNGVSVVTALSLGGLRERGWRCGLVAPRYPDAAPDVFGHDPASGYQPEFQVTLPSVAFPVYPDLRLSAPRYRVVADAVRRFQPDLVHCATEFVVGRLGQMAAHRQGIPTTSSFHTDFGRYMRSYGLPWLRPAVTSYLRRFHTRSRRVYTPSYPVQGELHTLGLRDVEVWGRGVDCEQFHPSRASRSLRDALGIGESTMFLHVGRLAAEKNVQLILEAFRMARARAASPMTLVIAGSGPSEPALRASAPDGVIFLGNLDRARALPELYASSDAFLFASETETLGLVVLEAMASGIPVIATPAGGVADHLHDGENGLAYPPGDAVAFSRCILRLANSPGERAMLSDGAIRTAQARSWTRELDLLDASYRELLGPRPRMLPSEEGVPAQPGYRSLA